MLRPNTFETVGRPHLYLKANIVQEQQAPVDLWSVKELASPMGWCYRNWERFFFSGFQEYKWLCVVSLVTNTKGKNLTWPRFRQETDSRTRVSSHGDWAFGELNSPRMRAQSKHWTVEHRGSFSRMHYFPSSEGTRHGTKRPDMTVCAYDPSAHGETEAGRLW